MSTSTQPSAEFSEALSNVRRQTTSKLSHNSKPAQLLNAIEQTLTTSLKIDTLPHSPTAYFISLLQCLEKAVNDDEGGEEIAETENMGQGALIPAVLYLLGIVIPETPANVVISKLSTLLESILPLFENAMEHPPALRSLVTIIPALILFATPSVLNSSPLLKKSWAYLLELNLDARPKVRHLAQEGVRKVLTTPIPPKLVPGGHPYLPKAREWVEGILEEESKGGASSKKKARFVDGEDGEGKRAIWVVQGLRGWAAVWGEAVCPFHIRVEHS
jgi:ribosomal RNA-processing protein 12